MSIANREREVNAEDIAACIAAQSNLGLELRVLDTLAKLRVENRHGGTYDDPLTKQPHKYGIQANIHFDYFVSALGIECFNAKPSAPVVLETVPRSRDQSYHELLFAYGSQYRNTDEADFDPSAMLKRTNIFRVPHPYSVYKQGQPAGLSCRQLDPHTPVDQTELHNTWYNALNSAANMGAQVVSAAQNYETEFFLHYLLPVVVVPDETLWVVEYDTSGNKTQTPQKVDRCSFFVDRSFELGSSVISTHHTLSHVEFVTLAGLKELLTTQLIGTPNKAIFPDHIRHEFAGIVEMNK